MTLGRDTAITWYGHSCVEIRTPGGKTVIVDPFFANPNSPKAAAAVDRCDVMLVTHGHFDHMGDAVQIASRTRAAWPAIHEMSLWLARRLPGGQDAVIGMNKGGTVELAGLGISMTTADHSAGDWNGDGGTTLYLGDPAGFVVEMENGFKVYHAGDTELTYDLRLVGELHKPDVALIPIGGHFTMGPRAAAMAVEFLGVKHVLPIHWGTFPALSGTPQALRDELAARGLGDVTVHEPGPGGTIE